MNGAGGLSSAHPETVFLPDLGVRLKFEVSPQL